MFRTLEYRFNILKIIELNIGSSWSILELQWPPWGTWDMNKTIHSYDILASQMPFKFEESMCSIVSRFVSGMKRPLKDKKNPLKDSKTIKLLLLRTP